MKKCPVPGCSALIPVRRFVCQADWDCLPVHHQEAVKQAKRHIQQYRDDPVRVGVWRMAHVRAKEAAIASIVDRKEKVA